jgi:hypothetical protein
MEPVSAGLELRLRAHRATETNMEDDSIECSPAFGSDAGGLNAVA